MYAIVRSDVQMSPGKVASQAGHAFVGAFLDVVRSGSGSSIFYDQAVAYSREAPGTKVCLSGSLVQILKLQVRCQDLGLPHFLVVDSGCENFYGGEPTVTAFGLGPLLKHQSKPVVGKFRLHI